jgi:hypothetical protein
MVEWEPVAMGEPQVTSDPEYPAMVIVYVPLTGTPDEVWSKIFNSGPPAGVSHGIGLPFPQAQGSAVVFRCPPSDVEKQFDLANEAEERRKAVDEARKRLGQG